MMSRGQEDLYELSDRYIEISRELAEKARDEMLTNFLSMAEIQLHSVLELHREMSSSPPKAADEDEFFPFGDTA